ncbi:MAG: hypothetical protein GF317_07755 [Candidatus Lokiarchaeota archaeon]|nr:hypothetical protein [Candidatus Lokiarchaeota archaeon]MBD3199607.1 hypothetical protein [Candidatus Lokiarchaeota archaeon]
MVSHVFLDKNLIWNPIETNIVQTSLNIGDLNISGKYIFDESSLIREFSADRYYTKNEMISLEEWHGYLDDYEEFDGIRIPSKFKVCWNLDDGEYCYIKGKVVDIEFNNPRLY